MVNVNGKIIVPENITHNKLLNIERLGGKVEFYGNDCIESEFRAREISKEIGSVYISPYNDTDIITGQGTIGIELDNQLNNIDEVIKRSTILTKKYHFTKITTIIKKKNP